MALPSDIASTKASATRASVAPRCRNSAPDDASATITLSTAGGEGSLAPPTNSAAIHQIARNRANDRRRSTSVSANRVIEGAGIELRHRPDQVAAADLGQHAIENARIRLFVSDAAARDSLAIAVAIGLQQGGIAGAGQRRDLLPRRIRGHQQLLGLAGHGNEPRDRVAMTGGPGFVEDVADHRDRSLGAELGQDVLDAGEAAEAFGLELRAKIPEIEARIHLAVERLRRQQGRGAVNDAGFRFEVDAVLLQPRLEE